MKKECFENFEIECIKDVEADKYGYVNSFTYDGKNRGYTAPENLILLRVGDRLTLVRKSEYDVVFKRTIKIPGIDSSFKNSYHITNDKYEEFISNFKRI